MLGYIVIFIISLVVMFFSGSFIVGSLVRIARYFRLREFVIAFFVMAFASSLPNLFVGINSVIKDIPQLSFGDIMGGNIVNITLAIALAVFACKKGGLPAESRMVQTSAIFTVLFAILPFALIYDGVLSRIDGFILILFFFLYVFWLFAKKERFIKSYEANGANNNPKSIGVYLKGLKNLFKDICIILLGLVGLLLSSKFIVSSSQGISLSLGIGLPFLGVLLLGLGDTMPEIYFGIVSARKGQNWMILGDILGAIIFPATLILGIIAMLHPIIITDFSPFLIARVFLVIAALYFLFAIKTGQKITKKEGVVLLLVYVAFLAVEILTNYR